MNEMEYLFDIIAQTDPLIFLLLAGVGCGAYIISTISGGGGALLLVPIMNFTIGTATTVPVLNLGNLIGRPARLIIFWKYIERKVVLYYAPLPSELPGWAVGSSARSGSNGSKL